MTFSWHGDAPTGGGLYPRYQLPPSPTPRTAGLPAGQARARRLQVRAAIVHIKWQRRANTPEPADSQSAASDPMPPLPAAPGRGGGNTRWVRRKGGGWCWGVWGFGWEARPRDECVHVRTGIGLYKRVARGATCDGHRVGGVGGAPSRRACGAPRG